MENAPFTTSTFARRRLLRSLPLPLVAAVAVGGLVGLATPGRTPGYDARAAVHINQQTASDPVRRVTRIVPSEILDALTAPALRTAVAAKLGLQHLRSSDITVAPRLNSGGDVLDVTATATTAAGADRLATTYAQLGAARIEVESQQRLTAAIILLDKEQAKLAASQGALARADAALPLGSAQRAASDEQLSTLNRQRTQLAGDRDNLLTTAALLGPAAQASPTLEVTQAHGVSPKLLRGALAGIAAALLVTLGLLSFIVLRHRLPVLRAGDNESGLTVLAVVPRRKTPSDATSEAERAAVSCAVDEILLDHRSTGSSLLGVAAPTRHCGTSTMAASLAAGLARRGLRVLLIDADVRNPAQHFLHGVALWPGLVDLVNGRQAEPIVTANGVQVLVAGFSSTPADLLGHQALVQLLQQARNRYDVVVVDIGSLEHSEARLVAALTDRVLLCAVPGRTSQNRLDTCLTSLRAGTLLGLVLIRCGRLQPAATAHVRRTPADPVKQPSHEPPRAYEPPREPTATPVSVQVPNDRSSIRMYAFPTTTPGGT